MRVRKRVIRYLKSLYGITNDGISSFFIKYIFIDNEKAPIYKTHTKKVGFHPGDTYQKVENLRKDMILYKIYLVFSTNRNFSIAPKRH